MRGVVLSVDGVYFYGWGKLASGLDDAHGDFASVACQFGVMWRLGNGLPVGDEEPSEGFRECHHGTGML